MPPKDGYDQKAQRGDTVHYCNGGCPRCCEQMAVLISKLENQQKRLETLQKSLGEELAENIRLRELLRQSSGNDAIDAVAKLIAGHQATGTQALLEAEMHQTKHLRAQLAQALDDLENAEEDLANANAAIREFDYLESSAIAIAERVNERNREKAKV